MNRTSSFLAATTLLAAAAHAQCYTTPAVGPVTLVQWSSTSSYTSTFPPDDEGITNPPIDLTPAFGPAGFPMAGAVGTLNQMWINSNGEVYLSDSAAALLEPAGGASFGVNSLAEARGPVGGSPRIFPLGGDHEGSVAAGAAWAVTCDVTPGQVKVSWTDMARFANTTDRFSFACTLFASGAVQFEYGNTFPAAFSSGRYVGISIGNEVGSTSSPSRNLTAPGGLANSGTEGLLYEAFTTTGSLDLNDKTILISPNGIGGYVANQICGPAEPAANFAYGAGCHSFLGADTDDVFELFADHPSAKAALDGNALQFTLTPTGYVVNWLPGAAAGLFVAPSVGATITANVSSGTESFSPSVAIPIPGGTAATWTLSSEGILTAAATGNQGSSTVPSLTSTVASTGLAFYTWHSQNPTEAGSGKFVREEVGGVLYVTANGVESTGTPTVSPGTYQWQVNLTSGDVTMLWTSFTATTSTSDVLVGCTLAGTGIVTPVSQSLAALSGFVMAPQANLNPVTLSASPAPVINPSTLVTYTATNLPEFVPGSGLYISTMFLSVAPLPGGFPLTGILTTVPGCNAYIGSLDIDLGGQLTLAPTATWSFNYDNVNFAPGNIIGTQVVSLFDGSFPLVNGEAGGFLFSNGVATYTQPF